MSQLLKIPGINPRWSSDQKRSVRFLLAKAMSKLKLYNTTATNSRQGVQFVKLGQAAGSKMYISFCTFKIKYFKIDFDALSLRNKHFYLKKYYFTSHFYHQLDISSKCRILFVKTKSHTWCAFILNQTGNTFFLVFLHKTTCHSRLTLGGERPFTQ